MNRKPMMLMFSLFLLLAGCSSNEKDDSASESQDEKAESKMDASISGNKVQEVAAEKEGMTDERKVIHQAQLELKVKNLEKAQMKLKIRWLNMADMLLSPMYTGEMKNWWKERSLFGSLKPIFRIF
ncbi:hypothetical protein [Peribacillus frigoritolerans]|uniref:hypothetical protein n=1 Tax=Peribacillus frigoritolerans TaxID=450367 RepID=UPI0020BDF957|nr:hypothetical protein [Peribacillus frigoritolerans]